MESEKTTNEELMQVVQTLLATSKEQGKLLDIVITNSAEQGRLLDLVATTLAAFQQNTLAFQQNTLAFQQNTTSQFRDIRTDIEDLKKGQFTEDEKTDLMAIVRYSNQRMENEALGKKDITLNREEYDATALGRGFKNRFKAA